jgi:hypothetical protein
VQQKKVGILNKHLNGAVYIADVAILKRESNASRSEWDLEFDIEMCLPRHRHDVGEFAHQPATATTTTWRVCTPACNSSNKYMLKIHLKVWELGCLKLAH